MERLKTVIEKHGRWKPLEIYVERIETYLQTDFSLALENAKALLESVGVQICKDKGIKLNKNLSVSAIIKKAFLAIGYKGDGLVNQVSKSLANIGQQMGNLRNEIGSTAHGKSLEEIKERNSKVDELTKELLIDTTDIICCFLIRSFESENPRYAKKEVLVEPTDYLENSEFNENWDEAFGEFVMGEYSYSASEILFNVDVQAYVTESKGFKAGQD